MNYNDFVAQAKAEGVPDAEIQKYIVENKLPLEGMPIQDSGPSKLGNIGVTGPQDMIEAFKQSALAPPKYTVGGFLGNAAQDVGNVIGGIAQIPSQIGYGITHPDQIGNMTTNTIKGIGNEYNNLVGQPINPETGSLQMPDLGKAAEHFYNHPVQSGLDVLPVASVAKNLIGKLVTEGVATAGAEVAGETAAKSGGIPASGTSEGASTATSAENAANMANKASDLPPKPPVETNLPKPDVNIGDISNTEAKAFLKNKGMIIKAKDYSRLDPINTSKGMLEHIKSGMTITPDETYSAMSGSDGISTVATKDILNNTTTPIDLSNIDNIVNNKLKSKKSSLAKGGTSIDNILSDIKAQLEVTPSEGGNLSPGQVLKTNPLTGEISITQTSMSASEAMTYARELEKLAEETKSQSTVNVASKAEANAYNSVAKDIIKKINESIVKDGAVSKIDVAKYIADAEKISPLYGKQMAEALTDKTVPLDKVRSTAATAVKWNEMVTGTIKNEFTAGTKFREIMGEQGHTLGDLVTNPKGTILKAISNKINEIFVKPQVPHDFSKPFEEISPKTNVLNGLPKVLSGIKNKVVNPNTITGLSLIGATKNGQQNGQQYQYNPINSPTNNNESNNIQGQSNHNVIIPQTLNDFQKDPQTGNYTLPSYQQIIQSSGKNMMSSVDYNNQKQALLDQAATPKGQVFPLSGQIEKQLSNLESKYSQSKPLETTYNTVNSIDQVTQDARDIMSKIDPSIFNRSGWIDLLRKSTDPNYNTLARDLDFLQKAVDNKLLPNLSTDSLPQSGQTPQQAMGNLDYIQRYNQLQFYNLLSTYGLNSNGQNTSLPSQLPSTPVNNSGGWVQALPPNPLFSGP